MLPVPSWSSQSAGRSPSARGWLTPPLPDRDRLPQRSSRLPVSPGRGNAEGRRIYPLAAAHLAEQPAEIAHTDTVERGHLADERVAAAVELGVGLAGTLLGRCDRRRVAAAAGTERQALDRLMPPGLGPLSLDPRNL